MPPGIAGRMNVVVRMGRLTGVDDVHAIFIDRRRPDGGFSPRGHGAPYAFTIRATRGRPRGSHAGILLPTSVQRRSCDLRGHDDLYFGPRMAGSTRPVFGSAGRRMEEDNGRCPCQGRPHVLAALAYWTDVTRGDDRWRGPGLGVRQSCLLAGCVSSHIDA